MGILPQRNVAFSQQLCCLCFGAGISYLIPHLEFIRTLFSKIFAAQKTTSKKMSERTKKKNPKNKNIGQGQSNQDEKK
jgi:hypothetical protein